jgi:DNA-damage-inducible protein D
MKIYTTQTNLEKIKHIDEKGHEYWSARELMKYLGYAKWDNFEKVIDKAKGSIRKTYQQDADHFTEIRKMIKVAKGTNKEAERPQKDYRLSRYACYVIAQNGDPSKKEIAEAQSYFAIQTRKEEIREEYEKDLERIKARERLRETERIFSGVLAEHKVGDRELAEIRSSGDEALFDMPTRDLKDKFQIPQSKPLADVLPTISLTAKQLATEMTTIKTKQDELKGKDVIKSTHISNNKQIRKLLADNNIYLEKLPPEEDIEKIKRRIEITDDKIKEISSFLEITIDLTGLKDEDELKRIRDLIINNFGDNKLKIIYGTLIDPKFIEKPIKISEELLKGLRRYLVLKS